MLSILGFAFLVFAPPIIELTADIGASAANHKCTISFEQVADCIVEVAFKNFSPQIYFCTVSATFKKSEATWPRGIRTPIHESIALTLYHNDRAPLACERSYVVEPIDERLVTQRDTVF